MRKFTLFIFALVGLSGNLAVAQQDTLQRKINQRSLDSLLQLKEYNYDRVIEEPSSPILSWIGESLLSLLKFFGTKPGIFLLCLILLVILVLAFKNKFNRKKKVPRPKANNSPISVDTDNSFQELNDQLSQALKEFDYRAAIRFQFIRIIKMLDNRKLIRFHIDKTNRDYLHALPKEYQDDFALVAKIFDYAWYGNVMVDQSLYQVLDDFSKKIKGGDHVA